MQVKQRLNINVIIAVLSAVIILSVLFTAQYRINLALEKSAIADEIFKGAFERSTFRDDYLRTNSERARMQWFAKYEQIGKLLETASEMFSESEDRKIIDELIKDQQATKKIFSAIVENRGRSGLDAGSAALSQEIESRLGTQLSMRLYDKILNIGKLHESAGKSLFSAQRLAGLGIFSAFVIIIAATLINSWTMRRIITDGILRLRDGAAVIGGGNLEHRIEVKGDDEFAGLSDSFNAMTVKLLGTHTYLTNEIAEREWAEEALRKVHEDLEIRVGERTKELKELNETLEQRVMGRTAELQAANALLLESRRAALNIMEDAVAARRQIEETSEKLRREVIDHERAEEALRESEERYRSIFEGANDGIIACDLTTGKFLFSNEKMSALIGYSTEEITMLGVKDIHPPKDLPYALNEFNEMAAGQKTETRAMPVLRKDGSVISCDISCSFLNKTILIGFFRDVTERRRVEAELIEKQHFVESINEATPDILYIFDVANNSLVYANKGLKQLLGHSPEEVRQMGAAIYQELIHPDDLSVIAASRAQGGKVEDGQLINVDLRVKHADGQWRWLSTRSVVFSRDSEGLTTQVLGSARDITEKMEAEQERERLIEELKKSNMELAEVNKELDAFSYAVSNDLMAPLRSIEGFTAAITEDYAASMDKTANDYFNRVIAASRRMSQLINAMLNMARLTRGALMERTVNLSDLAEVAAHELGKKCPERRVEIVIAKGVKAQGDIDMLRTVIENLFDNAYKFTGKNPAAKIEFGVTEKISPISPTGLAGPVYFVRDDGVGFDMEYAWKLFKPFSRLHAEADFPGIGIGLSTVQRIIRRHGGKIWAESAPGKGATFYFTLR